MMCRVLWLAFIGAVALTAQGADMFKWVDERGVVHYGESVPERYKKKATKVGQRIAEPTDAQRREAEERLTRDRARAQARPAPDSASNPPPAGSGAQSPASRAGAGAPLSCEEQKRRYEESQQCFHPFRLANGGVKPEAFERCVDVKEPPRC